MIVCAKRPVGVGTVEVPEALLSVSVTEVEVADCTYDNVALTVWLILPASEAVTVYCVSRWNGRKRKAAVRAGGRVERRQIEEELRIGGVAGRGDRPGVGEDARAGDTVAARIKHDSDDGALCGRRRHDDLHVAGDGVGREDFDLILAAVSDSLDRSRSR